MNKCQITEDLLPLYIDEVCTDGSRQFIDTHVSECPKCAALLKQMQTDTHAEKEAKLQKEKDVALRLHRKKRDADIVRSLTLALAFAYLPVMLLLAAVVKDNGLISVNYPLKLLTLVLYTLPLLIAAVHWGFTASFAIERRFTTPKEKLIDAVGNAFSLLSAAFCFIDLPYLWLYGSLLLSLAAVIIRLAEKKLVGLSFEIGKTVREKSFAYLLVGIIALSLIIALTSSRLSDTKNKPDPDAPTVSTVAEETFI